jgi:hypothetical protein
MNDCGVGCGSFSCRTVTKRTGSEIHCDLVEWNYRPSRVPGVQSYNEKAKIKRAALAGDAKRHIHLVM